MKIVIANTVAILALAVGVFAPPADASPSYCYSTGQWIQFPEFSGYCPDGEAPFVGPGPSYGGRKSLMSPAGRPAVGTPINVRLPDDVLADLDAYAARKDISRAEVVRQAVKQFLWDDELTRMGDRT